MNESDNVDHITSTSKISGSLTRRSFIKTTAVLSSTLMLEAAGSSLVGGNAYGSEWAPVAYPKVLLYNFGLFDGEKNQIQKRLVLLVEGDTILSIEPEGELAQYEGFKLVDLDGRTILPGLIDNHVHMTVPFMYNVNMATIRQMNGQIALNFKACVNSGVTTVRDVGGFPAKINKFRAMADTGEIPGPRVISSLSPIAARRGDALGAPEVAPYFTNPVIKWFLGGNYAERPTNVDEIEEACERMIKLGAQWLKTLHQDHAMSYNGKELPNHSDEGYRTILRIGREHGIKCALHEPLLSGFKKGVDLGYHTLEHMPVDAVIPDEYIERFAQQEMAMMPTVIVVGGDDFIGDELLGLVETRGKEFLMPEAVNQVSTMLKDSLARDRKAKQDGTSTTDRQYGRDMFPNLMENLRKLHSMGATVGMGTDLGGTYCAFFGRYADELKHFATAGISNVDILRAATSVNARIIDMHNKIGKLEKGKLADIIAVRGNPLEDIRAMGNVDLVMKGGTFMKAEGVDLA